jgi:hypothetical protein
MDHGMCTMHYSKSGILYHFISTAGSVLITALQTFGVVKTAEFAFRTVEAQSYCGIMKPIGKYFLEWL